VSPCFHTGTEEDAKSNSTSTSIDVFSFSCITSAMVQSIAVAVGAAMHAVIVPQRATATSGKLVVLEEEKESSEKDSSLALWRRKNQHRMGKMLLQLKNLRLKRLITVLLMQRMVVVSLMARMMRRMVMMTMMLINILGFVWLQQTLLRG